MSSEKVVRMKDLQEELYALIPTKMVKIRQENGFISVIPIREYEKGEHPLMGLTANSTLTVDKFLAMKREDRMLEGV